ncbi:MAG: hypothetical protein ACYTJ0_19905 [Planctomycetota bacterium]
MPGDEPSPGGTVEDERYCVRCSYDLRGLPVTGNCPECGTPVARALQGDLLEYSSPEYLGSLARGITIVLVASIGQFVLMMLAVVIGFAAATGRLDLRAIELLAGWIEASLSLVVIYGWWLFSIPDPAVITEDTGANARKVLRVCVVVSAAGVIATNVMKQTSTTVPGASNVADVLSGVAAVPAVLASLVLFFASLLYVRWLARRIPDRKVDEDARRYLWLLPLLYIVLACVVVGPFIATIMYLLLLNRVRIAIGTIRERQQPLPDVA